MTCNNKKPKTGYYGTIQSTLMEKVNKTHKNRFIYEWFIGNEWNKNAETKVQRNHWMRYHVFTYIFNCKHKQLIKLDSYWKFLKKYLYIWELTLQITYLEGNFSLYFIVLTEQYSSEAKLRPRLLFEYFSEPRWIIKTMIFLTIHL